jgi:hypothetical protein
MKDKKRNRNKLKRIANPKFGPAGKSSQKKPLPEFSTGAINSFLLEKSTFCIKKKRHGNSKTCHAPTVYKLSASEYVPTEKNTFFATSTGINLPVAKDVCPFEIRSVQSLQVAKIDRAHPKTSFLFIANDVEDCHVKQIVAWKASHNQCEHISPQKWKQYKEDLFEKAMELKPDVIRSPIKRATNYMFKCFGTRLDYSTGEVGTYVYKKNVPAQAQDACEKMAQKLVRDLEQVASSFLQKVPFFQRFECFRDAFELETLGEGLFTQLCISKNYWSPVHKDNNYSYTIVACFSEYHQDVPIYHFNFPTFNHSIPLKSGDVMVFDSSVPHCSSNPEYEECYIMSTFVSQKTVRTVCYNQLRGTVEKWMEEEDK